MSVAACACIVCLLILHVCTGSSATCASVSDSVFAWILSLAISRVFLQSVFDLPYMWLWCLCIGQEFGSTRLFCEHVCNKCDACARISHVN